MEMVLTGDRINAQEAKQSGNFREMGSNHIITMQLAGVMGGLTRKDIKFKNVLTYEDSIRFQDVR